MSQFPQHFDHLDFKCYQIGGAPARLAQHRLATAPSQWKIEYKGQRCSYKSDVVTHGSEKLQDKLPTVFSSLLRNLLLTQTIHYKKITTIIQEEYGNSVHPQVKSIEFSVSACSYKLSNYSEKASQLNNKPLETQSPRFHVSLSIM